MLGSVVFSEAERGPGTKRLGNAALGAYSGPINTINLVSGVDVR
jgi:hypothetical protein